MNNLESYSLLFTDSLVSNLAINANAEFVIYSMKMFGNYSHWLMIIIASSAFIVAISLNYLLGRLLFNIFKYGAEPRSDLLKLPFLNSKSIFLILLLSAIPFFGKFIPLFAGLKRLKFMYVIWVCAIAKFCYYGYILLL